MEKLKHEIYTTEQEIQEQKRHRIEQNLYQQAVFQGKNITTVKREVLEEERQQATEDQIEFI